MASTTPGWRTLIALLPCCALADSLLQTGPAQRPLSAAAHVDFQIVIPTVLSLELGRTNGPQASPGGQASVAVYSNGRSVTLVATQRAATAPSPAGVAHAGNVILNAAARKVIATRTACTPQAAEAGPHGYLCTIAAP